MFPKHYQAVNFIVIKRKIGILFFCPTQKFHKKVRTDEAHLATETAGIIKSTSAVLLFPFNYNMSNHNLLHMQGIEK